MAETYQEWKKRKYGIEPSPSSTNTSSSGSTKTTGNESYEEWKKRKAEEGTLYSDQQRAEARKFQTSWGLMQRNYNQYITQANDFFQNASKEYISGGKNDTAERLRSQGRDLLKWFDQYGSYLDADAYRNIVGDLQELDSDYGDLMDFYSQFETQDAYDMWDAYSTPEKRQARYEQNQTRLEELKKQRLEMTGLMSWGTVRQDTSDIDAEIAAIEREMQMYERGGTDADTGFYYGSKVVDDYSGYLNDPNYGQFSAEDFRNPTKDDLRYYDAMMDQSTWYQDNSGNTRNRMGDIVTEYVNADDPRYQIADPLGVYLQANPEDISNMHGDGSTQLGVLNQLLMDGYYGSWDQLDEREREIYYTLLGTQGKEAAMKYLSDMETELNRRNMAQESELYKLAFERANGWQRLGMSAVSIPANLLGGATAFVDDLSHTVRGEDINPYSAAHQMQNYGQQVRANQAAAFDESSGWEIPGIGFSAGDLYQAAMSTADMFGGAMIGPTAYGALMGMGAASSEARRLYEMGASKDQIFWGSAAAGAAELVFEKFSIEKLIDIKDADTLGKLILNALKQGGIEASEEGATELANLITNNLIMTSESDWAKLVESNNGNKWAAAMAAAGQIGEAAAGGFVSGFMGGTGSATMNYAQNYVQNYRNDMDQGKAIQEGDGLQSLRDLAMAMAEKENGKAQAALRKQSDRLGQDYLFGFTKDRDAGRLYRAVQNTVAESNKEDVANALQKQGYSQKEARKIADAFYTQAVGLEVSKAQQKVIQEFGKNEDVQKIIGDLLLSSESTIAKRNQDLQNFRPDVIENQLVKKLEEATGEKIDLEEMDTAEEIDDSAPSMAVSEDGSTRIISTGKPVNITGFAKSKDGKAMLRTDTGEVVAADDVSYANDSDALIYETIANLGAPVSNANGLLSAYKGKSTDDAEIFARGIQEAFEYGQLGIPMAEMADSAFASKLSKFQMEYAYKQGKKAADKRTEKAEAVIRKNQNASKKPSDGKVHFEGSRDGLNDRQRVSLDALETVAKATGIQIYVYESKVGANGQRIGANGWYNQADGSIHIDLYAGQNAEAVMLFTAAHELTHFIAQWSPRKFKVLANFLMEEYGKKGVSVENLINDQIDKAKRNGRELSRDEAYEEVIADSMETMLADGNVVKKLARLQQQDRTLVQKIKDFIDDLVNRIRKVYAGMVPNSAEGKYVAEMKDSVEKIQQTFTEALMEASGNYQMAENNTTGDGGVKMETRSVNGEQVVWIEDNVLKENKGFPVHQFIANYIAEHIGEVYTIIESGQKVYIGEDLPGEYTQSKYTQTILKSNPSISRAKNRASANLGEMIEIATNRRWEKTNHTHNKDAQYGMYRYDTQFGFPVKNPKGDVIGANVYDAELLIRNASDGKKYLYDIVSIKKNTANSAWLTQKVTSAAGKPAVQKGDVSKNSIRNSNLNVKRSDRDSNGNLLSNSQKDFFKDSVVRDKRGNLKVMYHGTSKGGHTVFDTWGMSKYGLFGTGSYFTDSKRIAETYTRKGKGINPEVYETYLNIKKPLDMDKQAYRAEWANAFRDVNFPENGTNEAFYRAVEEHYADQYIPKWEAAEIIRDSIEFGMGYDGITHIGGGRVHSDGERHRVYIVFQQEQVKNISNKKPTENPDIRYSDRDTESISNRSILANAFESVAQNDIEKARIQEYKENIDAINAEERKLQELRAKIKELSFAAGPKDTKAINELQFEANKTANRINTYDGWLLRLEASAPLKAVLEREKQKAYRRAKQRGEARVAEKVEGRKKTEMRHKIQNVVAELNRLLLSNDKKAHVPDSLKKAVADALDLVNMDTVDAEARAAKYASLIEKETDPDKIAAYTVTMENILRQGEKVGQRLNELRSAYEDIQKSTDPDIANAYDPVIAGNLKELAESIGNTSIKNMTLEQLSDVYDMYRMVLTRVRDANKALMENMRASIGAMADDVVSEVKRVGGEKKYRVSALDPVSQFLWNNLKPVYAMETIGSSTLSKVFENVRAGEDTWAVDVTDARKFFLANSKKYGFNKWDFKKKYSFESASGISFELTLDQILSLYAYSKREQAHDHLRLGGFVFDSNIETTKEKDGKNSILKYKVNTADAHQITPDILADITGNLSAEQKQFVDAMQSYLSDVMGAKGNEVTMKMYGVKLFKEQNYFPLKSAKQFMFEQNEVAGEVRIKNSGFTNKVVAKANNPVILSNFMDVWSDHVDAMSMYHAFTLPLEDFNRVFNYNTPKAEGQGSVSVKGTIQNAYGPAAVSYVKQLITDLNGGARSDSTTGPINKLMGMYKKGAVFASLSVVVQQPSAIARAAALIDTKYFIGRKVDPQRHKMLWNEVKKYAPIAIIKEMGYFDTNVGKSTRDFIQGKEYEGIAEKIKALRTRDYWDEVFSKAPALADEMAWCGIWEAVKRETKAKHPKMDVGTEEFLKLCGARFTEVITKTQVYDSVLSRSANMRSKDTGMKMATAFMAEPTTSINMIADALIKGKRGNVKYARTAIGAVIASQILNSILVSFVYAGRDDDEDETYWEKYVEHLTGNLVESLNAAGYIPFLRDIMSIVQGYDVERSDMSVISDLWKAWKNLSNDKMTPYMKFEGFVGNVAQIFGFPAKNIMRDGRGVYNTIVSFVDGRYSTKAGFGYAFKSGLPKWMGGGAVSNQNQLYNAYLNEDAKHIARIEDRYKEESDAHNALRKGLRENDPRIRTAAESLNTADYARYLEIVEEIMDEGHFDRDDVIKAIRSEASALAPEEGTGGSRAQSLMTAEQFAIAVANGDNDVAKIAMEDIIATAQENGKTESEAVDNFHSSAKSALKDQYLVDTLSGSVAEKALVAYCGMDAEEAAAAVRKWEFESESGFAYGSMRQEFLDKHITAAQARDALITYGGETGDDADDIIEGWQFESQYGFAWENRAREYKDENITRNELRTALMKKGGMTSEEADIQIQVYDWEMEGYDGASFARVRDYNAYCSAQRVPVDVYLYIRKFASNTQNDIVNGKAVDYSAVKKIMAEINAQRGLTPAQKTAIAKSIGWKDSTIRKYKLW